MSKAIFIRNPKCATMSIRAVGKPLGIRMDEKDYHQTALEWKQMIKDYEDHFVFTVVRNPYDRLLSGWHFICKRKLPEHKEILEKYGNDFQRFVLNLERDFKMKLTEVDMVTWPQWKWVLDKKGDVIVDEIGRFELLNNFWADMCKKHEWKQTTLPKSNSTQHANWKQVYTPKMKEIVFEQYKRDFELLGYKK